MKKYLVVTSFSEQGYHQYGKNFIDSWSKNWPDTVDLVCYHHSKFPSPVKLWVPTDLPVKDNIKYGNLDEIPELLVFKNGVVNLLNTRLSKEALANGIPWQLDAIKFTNKVFALAAANATVGSDYEWIIWLDADTVTEKKVTEADIDSWLSGDSDIVHLGRTATYYSETSFVGFKVSNPRVRVFMSNLLDMFLSGEFQYYGEWHDGFVFERLLAIHKWHGLKTKNLSENTEGLAAFQQSVLGSFMTHYKGNLKEKKKKAKPAASGPAPSVVPFMVNPVDCVAKTELVKNIVTNTKLIDSWVVRIEKHKKTAVIVSGGPSLEHYIPQIKKLQKRGADIFCVKHSFKRLVEAGVTPDFCVILDPREINGISTHGFVRKELFKKATADTKFMIASMTHPSVTRHFLKRGFPVIGFHTMNQEYLDFLNKNKDKLNPATVSSVAVGTCSAIRSLGLMELLGYSKVHMVGFDSSIDPATVDTKVTLDTGRPKYIQVGIQKGSPQPVVGKIEDNPDTRVFLTTGELVALYQDFMQIIPMFQKQLGISVMLDKDSLVGYGWEQLQVATEEKKRRELANKEKMGKPMDYKEFFNSKIPCYN